MAKTRDRFMDKLQRAAKGLKDSDFVAPQGTVICWGIKTCVGVAQRHDVIAVRNTNDSQKITALFSPKEWDLFIKGVKNGDFDLK